MQYRNRILNINLSRSRCPWRWHYLNRRQRQSDKSFIYCTRSKLFRYDHKNIFELIIWDDRLWRFYFSQTNNIHLQILNNDGVHNTYMRRIGRTTPIITFQFKFWWTSTQFRTVGIPIVCVPPKVLWTPSWDICSRIWTSLSIFISSWRYTLPATM